MRSARVADGFTAFRAAPACAEGDTSAAALAIRLPSGRSHQQPTAHLQQALLTLLQQAIGRSTPSARSSARGAAALTEATAAHDAMQNPAPEQHDLRASPDKRHNSPRPHRTGTRALSPDHPSLNVRSFLLLRSSGCRAGTARPEQGVRTSGFAVVGARFGTVISKVDRPPGGRSFSNPDEANR